MKYRADIDGMRAVAVGAVLLFHAEVPGFKGGFVGVDVFFVISGFLITSIIAADLERGAFSISRFYERRVRRIFPAFFAMMLVTVVAGLFVLNARELSALGRDAFAATSFVSNIVFSRSAGYFGPTAETNPLLHTWSLSVEEQFYLLFPLLMALLSSRAPKALKPCLLAGTVLSLLLSVWAVFEFPRSAFYLLPTRAWELSLGSILALGLLGAPRSGRQASAAGAVGLALIALSIGAYSERTPFPGLAALPPVAGTALVLWSGLQGFDTWCGRLLSLRPIVLVGLISYSLYLWHWPLIAYWKFLTFRPMEWPDSLAIIVVSLALGALSWRFVERPFRSSDGIIRERRQVLGYGGLAMLAAMGTGAWIWASDGFPGRSSGFAVSAKAMDATSWNKHVAWQNSTRSIGTSQQIQAPVIGDADSDPRFMLLGDSHALALIPAFESQALRVGISGYVFTQGLAPPIDGVGVKRMSGWEDGFDEARWIEGVLKFLESKPNVRTVILTARWPAYVHDHYRERDEFPFSLGLSLGSRTVFEPAARAEIVEHGLDRLADRLIQMQRTVVFVACVPEIGADVPAAYELHSRLPRLVDLRVLAPSKEEFERRQAMTDGILARVARRHEIEVVHPDRLLWDADGRVARLVDGELMYRDDDHLSDAGARRVEPCFDELFDAMARVGETRRRTSE